MGLEEGPHLVLYLHGGGDPRRAALRLMDLMARHPVALADLSRVNRGDAGLMAYLRDLGLYGRLAAYASWGTPANNLGSALAQGGLFLGREEERLMRLAEAYFQHWWGEVGRPWVRARFPEPCPRRPGGWWPFGPMPSWRAAFWTSRGSAFPGGAPLRRSPA